MGVASFSKEKRHCTCAPPAPTHASHTLTLFSCVCDVGFVGYDCGIPCPGYTEDALGTPTVCTKQGLCLPDGSCLCSSGYSGASCNMTCPSIASFSTPCSNLGTCVDGVCRCFPGFTGINCGLECKGGSDNPCSLNGDCQLDGSCVCYPGFRGESCSIECPGGAQNECNGNGVCNVLGGCDCFHGYRKSDCSKKCPGGLEGFLDGNQVVVRECSGACPSMSRRQITNC
jgi:tenascin